MVDPPLMVTLLKVLQHCIRGRIKLIAIQVIFADVLLYVLSISLVKASIVLFYRRIFATKRFRIVINYMLGLQAAWSIALFFVTFNPHEPLATCLTSGV